MCELGARRRHSPAQVHAAGLRLSFPSGGEFYSGGDSLGSLRSLRKYCPCNSQAHSGHCMGALNWRDLPSSGGRRSGGGIWSLPFCKSRVLQLAGPRKLVTGYDPHSEPPSQALSSTAAEYGRIEQCPFSFCPHCIGVCAICEKKMLDRMCASEIQCVYENEQKSLKTLSLLKQETCREIVGRGNWRATPLCPCASHRKVWVLSLPGRDPAARGQLVCHPRRPAPLGFPQPLFWNSSPAST